MAFDEAPARASRDYVLEEHIRAFTSASDRVRYIIFIILVVSVLAFGGFRNSSQDSWTNARVRLLRAALNSQLIDPPPEVVVELEQCEDAQERETPRCRNLVAARTLVELRDLGDEQQVRERLKLLEAVQIQQAYNIRVPFFGVSFDVNDLGMLAGITLFLLTLTHLLAISREHENLHLCLFQVQELCDTTSSQDDRSSEANFLYHALAMAQLFSRPKTLARWRVGWGRWLLKALLIVPLVVQSILFIHDIRTIHFGLLFKPIGTWISLSVQALSLLGISLFVTRSIIYSIAIDRLWDGIFRCINPRWASKPQPRWIDLIFLLPKPTRKDKKPGKVPPRRHPRTRRTGEKIIWGLQIPKRRST